MKVTYRIRWLHKTGAEQLDFYLFDDFEKALVSARDGLENERITSFEIIRETYEVFWTERKEG